MTSFMLTDIIKGIDYIKKAVSLGIINYEKLRKEDPYFVIGLAHYQKDVEIEWQEN